MLLHRENRGKMFTALLLVPFIFLNTLLFAQENATPGKKKIYTFELNENIFQPAWRLVQKAVDEAEAQQADYIIMRLNTYGGLVDIADSIRTRLLRAKPVMAVWIDNNAASAGALISLACDSIYMSRGANIGASTAVTAMGEPAPEKSQSYMRSMMRSTAEAQGRNPNIAEAMVDSRTYIEGVNDSGKIITFTTTEAIAHGYCDGEANSMEEVIQALGVTDYELVSHQVSWVDNVIKFFLNPAVGAILLIVIVGGIYFELQAPGIGLPLGLAVAAAVLYFVPLYLEGLAENWEILIFIGGLALMAVEIFVLPGFGVPGVLAIIMIVSGLTLSLIRNVNFDFSYTGGEEIAFALFRVVVTLLAGVVLFLFVGDKLMFKGPFKRLVLADTQDRNAGYSSQTDASNVLIGKTGIAINDLRPAGTVEIDNERYDVISDGEHILKGTTVKVVKVQGNYYVVARV